MPAPAASSDLQLGRWHLRGLATWPPAATSRSRIRVPMTPDVPSETGYQTSSDRQPRHSDCPQVGHRAGAHCQWRRTIRADPRKLRVYRVGVAAAGGLLIILGGITGPIPGPGGIPLVLAGLAVWASEFVWAHRLMRWFKNQLSTFRGWPRSRQTLGWIVFFLVLGALAYSYLAMIGIPGWLPPFAAASARHLPGV